MGRSKTPDGGNGIRRSYLLEEKKQVVPSINGPLEEFPVIKSDAEAEKLTQEFIAKTSLPRPSIETRLDNKRKEVDSGKEPDKTVEMDKPKENEKDIERDR